MSETHWEGVAEVAGELQAEILRGLLQAQGIPVWLSQEGAGRAYGLSVPGLGTVQILVPSTYAIEARTLLDEYYAGELEDEEPESNEVSESDPPGESQP